MKCAIRPERPQAVFFDAGETLIHPSPGFIELFLSVCAGHGLRPERRRAERVARALMNEVEERQREGFTFTTSAERSKDFWLSFYIRMLEDLGHEGCHEVAEGLYETFSDPRNYTLYDDAVMVLDRIREAGIKLGMISNFEPWLEDLLAMLDLDRRFDAVCISGKVGVEKPNREIFHLALEMAGVESSRSMHVGDSIRADVEGARGAGMKPVLLDRLRRSPEAGCVKITGLEELLPLVLMEGN